MAGQRTITTTYVGTLTRGLEIQPLLHEVFLGLGVIGQFTVLVVPVDEVLDDGAGLYPIVITKVSPSYVQISKPQPFLTAQMHGRMGEGGN